MKLVGINNNYSQSVKYNINKTKLQSSGNVSFAGNANYEGLYSRMMVEIRNMFYGCRPFGFHSPEGYIEVLKNFEIKDLMTLQGESAVFLMKNQNHILKISCAPYEDYIPEFHAPEYARGVITTSKNYPIICALRQMSTNKFYWVIQKKGILPVSETDKLELVKRAQEAGYDVEDVKPDQFAYFDGKAKFIDLGCVIKREKPVG